MLDRPLFLLSLSASILFSSAGCAAAWSEEHGVEHAPAAAEAIPVRLVPVTREAFVRPVHGVGRVRAATQVTLAFPLGGVVEDVRVVAGQRVRRGQLLATVDDDAAAAQLAAAQEALTKAERDASRAVVLEGAVVGRQQREDAQTGLAVAVAQRDAAQVTARRQAIVAPADGVILSVSVEEGATAAPGAPVLSFAGDDRLEVEVSVPSVDGPRVAVGDVAEVHIDAFSDAPFRGRVVERAGGAGALGGWRVTVQLDDDPRPLAPGLVASADVSPAPTTWPTVTVDAIAEADGSVGVVYAVSADGRAHRVPVRIAFIEGPRVALHEAPAGIDAVVAAGLPFLSDGALVSVAGGDQ